MRLLIDGYNVLFQSGLFGEGGGPGALQQARGALLRTIAAGLTPAERMTTTIVFDAALPPPGSSARFAWEDLTILFARDHDDADALIEELIARCPHPKQLTVVSTDRRIRSAARRRRATSILAELWFESIRNRPRSVVSPQDADSHGSELEKPAMLSERQVEEWRIYFDLPPLEQTDAMPPERCRLPQGPSMQGEPTQDALTPGVALGNKLGPCDAPSMRKARLKKKRKRGSDNNDRPVRGEPAEPKRQSKRRNGVGVRPELPPLPDPFPPGYAEPL